MDSQNTNIPPLAAKKKLRKILNLDQPLPLDHALYVDLSKKSYELRTFYEILEDGWRITKLKL